MSEVSVHLGCTRLAIAGQSHDSTVAPCTRGARRARLGSNAKCPRRSGALYPSPKIIWYPPCRQARPGIADGPALFILSVYRALCPIYRRFYRRYHERGCRFCSFFSNIGVFSSEFQVFIQVRRPSSHEAWIVTKKQAAFLSKPRISPPASSLFAVSRDFSSCRSCWMAFPAIVGENTHSYFRFSDF